MINFTVLTGGKQDGAYLLPHRIAGADRACKACGYVVHNPNCSTLKPVQPEVHSWPWAVAMAAQGLILSCQGWRGSYLRMVDGQWESLGNRRYSNNPGKWKRVNLGDGYEQSRGWYVVPADDPALHALIHQALAVDVRNSQLRMNLERENSNRFEF